MTTIDTSLAAIGIVKNYAHQSGWTVENTAPDSLARGVLNILAALAEREEQLSEVSQASAELHRKLAQREETEKMLRSELRARDKAIASAGDAYRELFNDAEALRQQLSAREADLVTVIENARITTAERNEAQSQLAAHDACLTQVREEMPEVEKLRAAWHLTLQEWSKDPDHPQFPAVTGQIRIFLDAIDTLQQNEARWRNSRDIWEAERNRLQQNFDLCLGRNSELQKQLSASNAACAEMREALLKHGIHSVECDKECWDDSYLCTCGLDALLTAQSSANAGHSPKQQEQQSE